MIRTVLASWLGLKWLRGGDTIGWGRAVVGDGQLVIRNGDSFVDVHDLATGRHRVRFDLDEGRAVTPD